MAFFLLSLPRRRCSPPAGLSHHGRLLEPFAHTPPAMPASAPRKRHLVRAGQLATAAGYFTFVLLFSSLLLLPRPNATATPIDAAAAFAAARPHLAHLRRDASSPASYASVPTCPAFMAVHWEALPHDDIRVVELPCGGGGNPVPRARVVEPPAEEEPATAGGRVEEEATGA